MDRRAEEYEQSNKSFDEIASEYGCVKEKENET